MASLTLQQLKQRLQQMQTDPFYFGEREGVPNGDLHGQTDATARSVQAMEQYGVQNFDDLPLEVRQQIPGGVWKPGVGALHGFLSSPAVWLAAGGVAGLGAGGGAAAGGAGGAASAGGSTGVGLTAAEEASMLGAAGGGTAGAGAASVGTGALGAGSGLTTGAGGGTALGSGITAAAPAQTALGTGALGSGLTTGASAVAPATTGAGMASGFLGLSTGDWVNLGTQLGGAMLQSGAAKDASRDQTAAANAAIGESRRQFDTTRADLAPWMQTGSQAISKVGDLLGISGNTMTPEEVMAMDPGYQFRLDEGLKAGRNIAGARGTLNSGATAKALTRYGQDYASGEFGNIYNRLAGASSGGQQAATNLGQFGATNAGNVGSLLTGAANARGAAGIGAANAWTGAANNIGRWFNENQMLDRILNSGSGGGTVYGGLYG